MEHCEILNGTGWKFYYDNALFPPGTDSFLLSSFPRLKPGLHVCDLGAGTGLLELLLLRRERELQVAGLEFYPGAVALAEKNITENGLSAALSVQCGDLRRREDLPAAGAFDLVVCNPPYFSAGSGASAGGSARRTAREETSCTLENVCSAAAYLLRWGGSFCLVHRPERLADLITALRAAGLEPKRLRPAVQRAGRPPTLLLLESRRGGRPGLAWEMPLCLTDADGRATREMDAIYCRSGKDMP